MIYIHQTARSNVCLCSFHDKSKQVKVVVHFQRLQVLGDSALQAAQLAVWECVVSKLAHLGLHTLRCVESLKRVSYQAKPPHSATVVQDGATILNARFYHPVIDVPNWRPARLIGELRASQGKKITWWDLTEITGRLSIDAILLFLISCLFAPSLSGVPVPDQKDRGSLRQRQRFIKTQLQWQVMKT